MTRAEIGQLWSQIYPQARWRYAKELAAFKAGTTVGELDKRKRAGAEERRKREREQRRQEREARYLLKARKAG